VAPAGSKGTGASLKAARTLFAPSRLDCVLSKLVSLAPSNVFGQSPIHGRKIEDWLPKCTTEVPALERVNQKIGS
jgi:hypothetical protein